MSKMAPNHGTQLTHVTFRHSAWPERLSLCVVLQESFDVTEYVASYGVSTVRKQRRSAPRPTHPVPRVPVFASLLQAATALQLHEDDDISSPTL
jgi:hypothetical protein